MLPVVVADGICAACGRIVPTDDYFSSVSLVGGLLVMDDTQALGLLGARPDKGAPLGHGGGGSLRCA